MCEVWMCFSTGVSNEKVLKRAMITLLVTHITYLLESINTFTDGYIKGRKSRVIQRNKSKMLIERGRGSSAR